ncbi:hypothetical protein COY90_02740 [Candidatus Roizmanbacteria bacterium CG_4_10_14_0_8_um_filter_39_9]|uniref:HIT domain-containing protein n=1 Tax=Candidatus Roizmanbacteria bacterium CG_4_10_14_0_8_um_filter_39_9 TaxID=1974829 RepID=A0A2M7QCW7_9BACT|nr:MAG: hypothetical protein COY90_02740 [Candidatus Roizmanbacteria bacterium CG_4_10_14_0_8_um_filter_39_9]
MDIFCQAETVLKDVIIHRTDNFFVVHDGFPLVEGHLFLIPKFHQDCFLNMHKKYLREYEALIKMIVAFLRDQYQDPVLFEHGIIAQTIPHAHLHFLPTSKSILNVIKQVAIPMRKPKTPYLLYGKQGKITYYNVVNQIEPGFLHKTFAETLRRPIIAKERAIDAKKWMKNVKDKWDK